MQLVRFSEILNQGARDYRHTSSCLALIAELTGQAIDADLASKLIEPMLIACSEGHDAEVKWLSQRKLEKWAPQALERIVRNSHMNRANGKTSLDNDTADALIVDYVNFASEPLDLALYTSDLHPQCHESRHV